MKKGSIIRLICVGIMCAGVSIGCNGILEPRDVIADATELISAGKNQAAIDILRPYIYKHQNSFEAHMLAGKAFLAVNTAEEKNLYVARHYFSSATKLAPNEGLRSQAAQAHYDVKMMMGKTSQAADTLVESAERMTALGESGQAANQFLQAARDYNKNEEYKEAIESCQKGISNNPEAKTYNSLNFTLARALFLEEKYDECQKAVKRINNSETDRTAIQNAEIEFLEAAAPILAMKGGLTFSIRMKKKFDQDDQQHYVDEFFRSLNHLSKMMPHAGVNEKTVIGRYALALARHAKNHGLTFLAKQAYLKSRTAFREAGEEKIAIEVGEELKDLKS